MRISHQYLLRLIYEISPLNYTTTPLKDDLKKTITYTYI